VLNNLESLKEIVAALEYKVTMKQLSKLRLLDNVRRVRVDNDGN